jgi:hypothetical protein
MALDFLRFVQIASLRSATLPTLKPCYNKARPHVALYHQKDTHRALLERPLYL